MSRIRFLSESRDTVTVSRADYRKLVEAAEAAEDLAAVRAHRAYEDRVGWDAARQNYLTAEEARRLLDGDNPIRVWREKRGLAQRVLAEAARVSASYLAEIESGKKPGSAEAIRCIADVLNVPMELLTETPQGIVGNSEGPVIRSQAAAFELGRVAELESHRIEAATHAVIARWKREANRNSLRHQLRATLDALRSSLTAISGWFAVARNQDAIADGKSEADLKRIHAALEKAVKILKDEARRL